MVAKLQFKIDQLLSRGANSLIIWLAGLSLGFVLTASYITWMFQIGPHETFGALFWDFMIRALTPWEIEASMGSLSYLLMMLAVTLFGIFVLSILISLLSAIIDARVSGVVQGKRPFPYSDHIVIIGYSSRLMPIIEELIKANESKSLERIVILSSLPAEDLAQTAANSVSDSKTTQLFLRSRDLQSQYSFNNVNILNARKILILGDEGPFIEADRLKIYLALQRYLNLNLPQNKKIPDILVNVDEPSAADFVNMVSNQSAVTIDVSNIPTRLVVETIEQPNLPEIYEEILSFDGNEFYITEPVTTFGLENARFDFAWQSFQESVVVGVLTQSGNLNLAPPGSLILSSDDKLVVIAEDDSTIIPRPQGDKKLIEKHLQKTTDQIKTLTSNVNSSELLNSILIIGLSQEHEYLVDQIIQHLPELKTLKLFLPETAAGLAMSTLLKSRNDKKIEVITGKTDDKQALYELDCKKFDTIIVTHTASYDVGAEDIESIRAMIVLREIFKGQDTSPHLVTEMLVGKNKDITSAGANSDFVVSEKIGSKVFAQFIENPHLQTVIDNLICAPNYHIRIIESDLSASLREARFGIWGAAMIETQRILIGWRYEKNAVFETHLNPGAYAQLPEGLEKLQLIFVEAN